MWIDGNRNGRRTKITAFERGYVRRSGTIVVVKCGSLV